ncbi:MAG: ribonuclease H [Clostridiaceae bacterium]
MEMLVFNMNIIDKINNTTYKIKISNEYLSSIITFNPIKKELSFFDNNNLTTYLKCNEYQLRKILHNKRNDTYFIGFKLIFSLRDGKDVAAFNDRNKIVVLDKRYNKMDSYVLDNKKTPIYKIYTDASYFEHKTHGGYAFIIENLQGEYKLYTGEINKLGSSQAELTSAIEAVRILKNIEKIRIITDSQYVRKGLTEWLPCWKLNNYKTANGEDAKNKENWIQFDELTNNKYIEFQWVKGHSNHFENSLCDMYAKDAGKSKKYL